MTGCCPLTRATLVPRDCRSAREMGRYVGRTGKIAASTSRAAASRARSCSRAARSSQKEKEKNRKTRLRTRGSPLRRLFHYSLPRDLCSQMSPGSPRGEAQKQSVSVVVWPLSTAPKRISGDSMHAGNRPILGRIRNR